MVWPTCNIVLSLLRVPRVWGFPWDSSGDSCGYGMGMGIEMPSPRQPWDPDVPPFTYSKYASAFMNTIHVIQRDGRCFGNEAYFNTSPLTAWKIWTYGSLKHANGSKTVLVFTKKSQSIKRIIIINQNSSGF